MALPFIQVRDLAPSASFYSAVMQPLGLRFISATSSSIVFGNPDPTFEVKASAGTPRPTRIVLSVSTPSAVAAFHAAAKRANSKGTCQLQLQENNGSGSSASVTDLEGNILEVSSTGSKVTRILSWNAAPVTSAIGTAQSTAGSLAASRPGLATLVPSADESYRVIRRSFTTSTYESAPPQQESSKGPSTGAIVGTVLGAVAAGVAVGAGLSYVFSSKKEPAARQQFEAPPLERRSTCPDPDQQPRYIEMERTVEKVRYPEQYSSGSHRLSQPAYTTRRLEASTPVVEEVDDYFSPHHSGSRARNHSIGPREPLLLTEAEHKSEVGSRHAEPRSNSRKTDSRRAQSPRSDRKSNVGLQRPESPYEEPETNSNLRRSPSPPAPPRAEPKSKVGSQPPPPPPPPPMPSHLGSKGSSSSRPPESSHRPATSRRASEAPSTDAKWRLHAELLKRTKSKDSSKASSQASDARSQVSSRGKHDDDRHNRGSRSKRDDDGRSSQVSVRSKHDGEDRHRHRSSRHKDDDDDSRSHVSSRSKYDDDRRHHKSSRSKTSRDVDEESSVSARGTRSSKHRDRTPTRKSHRASAREMQTPPEDDDGEGIGPDDSISCVGERPKPHARDLPFLHARERIMIG